MQGPRCDWPNLRQAGWQRAVWEEPFRPGVELRLAPVAHGKVLNSGKKKSDIVRAVCCFFLKNIPLCVGRPWRKRGKVGAEAG